MKLYGNARSSAAFRVRIALNLKGLDYDYKPVNLRTGEQREPSYLAINPQGLVPTLIDGETAHGQSIAILEYLEETYPEPALLPSPGVERARVRALAQVVACDIHPLNNLRVLNYLTGDLGLTEEDKLRWYRHWIATGLSTLEELTRNHRYSSQFCHGDTPTMADICLVPQIVNARRYECPLDAYPYLMRVFANCMALPPFDRAQPANQVDFA